MANQSLPQSPYHPSGALRPSTHPLILAVLDGNHFVFKDSLLTQGHSGGGLAARHLAQVIADFLYLEDPRLRGLAELSFWFTIYYSRSHLVQALLQHRVCTQAQLDSFLSGFSQSSARFSIVDVGDEREGVAVKIAAQIQTFARFPQTMNVFVGAGLDQIYQPTLAALDREQHLGKLVFLRSPHYPYLYSPLSHVLTVDHLFLGHELATPKKQLATLNIGAFGTIISAGGLLSPGSPGNTFTSGGGLPRLVDPNLPLHKQNPPPCNEHYLMSCSKGPLCKYSHDYLLTPAQLQELATNAKKAPCNWMKNGLICPYGNKCCWGHRCPSGPGCFHLTKNKCWFKGDAMHQVATPDEPSSVL